jgi:4-amino-4-deoxy-L-arabinose transferase-like glycosyltransferase
MWLAGIFALAIGLRLWLFSGVIGADDVSIAGIALETMRSGLALPKSHYALRLALTLPQAGIFSLFGVGEWQVALLPFAVSLAGIALAFLIGRRLGGERVGLVSAFLLALFPLDVQVATQLYPDAPLGVALAGSLYCALRAADSRRPAAWAVAAGLVWGVAYFVKIEAIFFGAVYLAMMALDRPRWRYPALAIVVFGAVVAAENLVYFARTGIWLYEIHVINNIAAITAPEPDSGLWTFPKEWFVTFYDFGLYYYFLAVACVWAAVTRQRWLYLPLVWVVTYLVWLQFGGNPFAPHYGVKSHLNRYCEMLAVPMAIVIAGFLVAMAERGWRSAYRLALAGIAATSLFFAVFDTLNVERALAAKEGIAYAVKHDAFPLYLDSTSADIAWLLLWDDPRHSQVSSFQRHSFRTGKTEVLDPETLRGYLLVNPASEKYKAQRYFMKGLDPEALKRRFPVEYTVNNPAPALAYAEARLLRWAATFLPGPLRDKIQGTADGLLQGEDVLIFRLGPTPAGAPGP